MAIFRRAWDSPTLTTWASFIGRSGNLLIVLPMAVGMFSAPEIQIWQLALTLNAVLVFIDLGLSPTFTRMFARAVTSSDGGQTDFEKVERIWGTMFRIYMRVGAAAACFSGLVGGALLWKAIHALDRPVNGWIILALLTASAPLAFLNLGYSAYLQGLNHVALYRRWEAVFSSVAVAVNVAILALGGGPVALVVATQFWLAASVLRNRALARHIEGGRARTFGRCEVDAATWQESWPAVWRSGLGVLLTSGFVQATGLIYAQIGDAVEVAAYLVALRYLTAIAQFSQAPFYSKLPGLARLHAMGRHGDLASLAERGMRLSHGIFAVGVLTVGLGAPLLIKRVGGSIQFVPETLWWIMALGAFLERFGAMHLQLYSCTNHIVWHVANGISGAIMITSAAILAPIYGAYGFAISVVLGYAGFYCWYSARLSYRAFRIDPLKFEASSSVPAAVAIAVAAFFQIA